MERPTTPLQTDVDKERSYGPKPAAMSGASGLADEMDLSDTPFRRLGDKGWIEFGVGPRTGRLSPSSSKASGRPSSDTPDRREKCP